jgi:hypothetical protein
VNPKVRAIKRLLILDMRRYDVSGYEDSEDIILKIADIEHIIYFLIYYHRISYIIFLSFQKNLKLAIFYISNQSSKHTKRRSQLSLLSIFYSNNGHKLTSKKAVKGTQASKGMVAKGVYGPYRDQNRVPNNF